MMKMLPSMLTFIPHQLWGLHLFFQSSNIDRWLKWYKDGLQGHFWKGAYAFPISTYYAFFLEFILNIVIEKLFEFLQLHEYN